MITETTILLLLIPAAGILFYTLFFVFSDNKFPITSKKRAYRILMKISFIFFWPLYLAVFFIYYIAIITHDFFISLFE